MTFFREDETVNSFFIDPRIEVRKTDDRGNGVFAKEFIPKHTVLCSDPIILFHKDTYKILTEAYGERHILLDYPHGWKDGMAAFCLGYGAVFNHSNQPNTFWRNNYELPAIVHYAKCDIQEGEEICSRYHPNSQALWFADEDELKKFEL